MLLGKLKINSRDVILFISILSIFTFRIYEILFPTNYQQDDISELRVTFFDNLFCALYFGSDNHPLFSGLIWGLSKLTSKPEYLISTLIFLITTTSLFLIFKLLEDKFTFEIALTSLVFLLFSPALITYSSSLKQYSFEFFASTYILIFINKNLKTEFDDFQINKFLVISSILFLFSFINIIPILLGILFVILKFKKINKKYFLIFLLPIVPFINSFFRKIQRINQGGYWDNFFITNNESVGLLDNFSFLLSLMLKSYFPENINFLALVLFIISIIFAIKSKDLIVHMALFGTLLIFIFSTLKIYPLGGGRTDLVFLPFMIIILSNAIYEFFDYFKLKKSIIYLFLFIFVINGFINSKPFYKNESVVEIIQLLENKYNNNDYEIIVISDQAPSITYYSKHLLNQVSGKDINSCMKTVPHFENLSVLKNNILYKNIYLIPYEVNLKEINKKNLIILGVELPGTKGSFREFQSEINNDYLEIDSFEFDNYMKLFYFSKNE